MIRLTEWVSRNISAKILRYVYGDAWWETSGGALNSHFRTARYLSNRCHRYLRGRQRQRCHMIGTPRHEEERHCACWRRLRYRQRKIFSYSEEHHFTCQRKLKICTSCLLAPRADLARPGRLKPLVARELHQKRCSSANKWIVFCHRRRRYGYSDDPRTAEVVTTERRWFSIGGFRSTVFPHIGTAKVYSLIFRLSRVVNRV